MAGQFFAVFAAAGLVSAGVAATGETRSATALPTVSVEAVAVAAKAEACKAEAVAQGADVVATLRQDRACYGAGQGGGEGVNALPIILGGAGAIGLGAALASGSNA